MCLALELSFRIHRCAWVVMVQHEQEQKLTEISFCFPSNKHIKMFLVASVFGDAAELITVQYLQNVQHESMEISELKRYRPNLLVVLPFLTRRFTT